MCRKRSSDFAQPKWVTYVRAGDRFVPKPAQGTPASGLTICYTVARFALGGPVLPLVTDTVRVAEAFRRAVMGRYQHLLHRRKYGSTGPRRQEPFRSEVLSGKDAAGQYLPGHDHAYYLPSAEGDDRRRLTHVTVCARRGFDASETAALTGLRQWHVGELPLRSQLVGLGQPSDFRTALLGGPSGAARVWVSATPYVGPAHVGRAGRPRYLRKALRREAQRWAAQRGLAVAVAAVEALADADPAWADRPRPFEYVRGRSRPGDDGYERPFGTYRLTFTAPLAGPLCLGYGSHYGLGLFLPLGTMAGPER